MRKIIKNIISSAAAAALIMSSAAAEAFAEPVSGTVTVSSAEELYKLAENCSIDSFSRGKTITLTNDIDLNGETFSPIPIFCGKLDGGGHTISNLRITEEGSGMGLFRTVEKNAEIKNLNLNGVISPKGSRNQAGAFAGVNNGSIINCTFTGSVDGETNVGGIVGINKETGIISNCLAVGRTHGKSCTGGIAGTNSGLILSCENRTNVNITASESKTVSASDINVDEIISTNDNSSDSNAPLDSCTDTGGIAGYSDGVIQSCLNTGTVGYPHIGYNTGGIAGRQSGYISGCSNSAKIYGRKEVGGIAGQSEPYMVLLPNDDMLDDLRTELDALNALIDSALSDGSDIGDTATAHLNNIQSYINSAKDSGQAITDGISNFADENINGINLLTADISSSLQKASLAADSFSEFGIVISDIADGLKKTIDTLSEISDLGDLAGDDIDDALKSLSECGTKIQNASGDLKIAISDLQRNSAQNAADDLGYGLSALSSAVKKLNDAFDDISSLSNTLKKAFEDIMDIVFTSADGDVSLPEISNSMSIDISDLSSIVGDISFSRPEISDVVSGDFSLPEISGIDDLSVPSVDIDALSSVVDETSAKVNSKMQNIDKDLDGMTQALQDAIREFENMSDALSELSRDVNRSINDLTDVTDDLTEAAGKFSDASDSLRAAVRDMDPLSDIMDTAVGQTDNVMDNLSRAGKIFEEACDNIKDAVDIIANRNPSPFVPLGSDVHKSSDDLFDSIDLITSESQSLTDDLNSDVDHTIDNLKEINAQVKKIYDLALDDANELLNGNGSLSVDELIQDTSDENIRNTREGKISSCSNTGSIDGDRNIGGITGAMAIERDLDPEDDIEDNISVRSKFETKSIIYDSINYGLINAKTDSVGGIAGRMDLGTVIDCQNYGDVTGGDYVGGIAGQTRAVVRGCYEKSRLSGSMYIGGITGSAGTIRNCCAVINVVEGSEYIGAIAGWADPEKIETDIVNNRFINTGTNGIDNISYENSAAPITFDNLNSFGKIPSAFTVFEMIFKADDRETARIKFSYGDDLSRTELPEVPEKEGYFGEWEKFDTSGQMSDVVINALYTPIITIMASEEKNNASLSLALVSGYFNKNSVLHAVPCNETPPVEAGNNANVYDIRIEGSDYASSDVLPLRLLIPDKNNAMVWQLVDGKWQTVKTKKNGQYMVFDMQGIEGTFCIASVNNAVIPIVISAAGVLIILAIIVTILRIRKKNKAKKKVSNN